MTKGFIGSFQSAGFNHCDKEVSAMFMDGKCHYVNFVREKDNQYDEYAVRIDCRGHKIGYVPRGYVRVNRNSDKTCPGNYNMFFAQCLDAGIEFKAVAVKRFQAKTAIGITTRFDPEHVVCGIPDIYVFADFYNIDANSVKQEDALSKEDLSELNKKNVLEFVCSCSYIDEQNQFQTGCGRIWYNAFSDSYFVWCGNNDNSISPSVIIHSTKKVDGIGMLAVEDCFINKQMLDTQNGFQPREEEIAKFLQRFSK